MSTVTRRPRSAWYDNYHSTGMGEQALNARMRSRMGMMKDQDRATPITVYPATRKEQPARICSRCFARNLSGETFCKVCGDELPVAGVDLDLGVTRRVDVGELKATLLIHGIGDVGGDVAIDLEKDISLVGRSSSVDTVRPDVDLSAFDESQYVSRRHAFILRRQGALVVEDLESINGTFVNVTQQLAPHVLTPLRDGDEITFGQTRCTVRIAGGTAR